MFPVAVEVRYSQSAPFLFIGENADWQRRHPYRFAQWTDFSDMDNCFDAVRDLSKSGDEGCAL